MSRLSDRKLLNPGRTALGTFHKAIDTGEVEATTLELAKIRASQINGCAICLTTHWKIMIELGERVDRLSTIVCWRECDWFTPREKAALLWAEVLTRTADHHVSDEDYAQVAEHFTEEEMVCLTWTIISINSWNRINAAFGSRPMHFAVPEQAAKP